MSDSFADLWNSTVPSKPSAPQKLGSIQAQQSQPGFTPPNRRPQNDLFTQLSAGSGPPSRTMTPSYTTANARNSPQPSTTASSGDAFSSLLSSDSGFSAKSSQNMTMAERAAEADRKRREQLMRTKQQQKLGASGSKANDAWAGLDSLGGLGGSSSSGKTTSTLDDDWGFGSSSTTATTATKSNNSATTSLTTDDDDWGLGEFSSKPVSTSDSKPKSQASNSGSLWDLDDFNSTSQPRTRTPPSRKPDSPSNDFDFGNREDEGDLLGGFGSSSSATTGASQNYSSTPAGEDDILGALGRPLDEVQKEKEQREREQKTRERRERERETSTRSLSSPPPTSSSPPPHILGRIVEMGFRIDQAKAALAATPNTGGEEAWVQSALDVLISNGAAASESEGQENGRRRDDDGWGDEEINEGLPRMSRKSSSQRGEPGVSRPHARREPKRTNTGTSSPPQSCTRSPNQSQQADAIVNIQEQADKIFAQASEIGKGLFSRAGAAWKEGKERVQKAYEDQYGSGSTSREGERGTEGRRPAMSGKPKWMVDAERFQDDEGQGGKRKEQMEKFTDGNEDRFRDEESHQGHEIPERRRRKAEQERERDKAKLQTPDVDLFSSETAGSAAVTASSLMSTATSITGAYVSKWRHSKPKDAANGSASGSAAPTPSRSPVPRNQPMQTLPSKPRTPPPHPTTLISASSSSLSLSSKHKSRATSAFKLGDYPAAESAYTQAIEILPEGHALCILLYNNRALTRLKMGNLGGVMEDTGVVCQIVGGGERGRGLSGQVKVSVKGADDKMEEVNLGDALVKAWKRRAEALEGKEKWDEAGKDWEAVAGAEWASSSIRGEGVRGAGRCRRMITQGNKAGGGDDESTPAAKPRPRPTPAFRPKVSVNPNSKALSSLRAANAAAESEDSEKHALKDSVDAKLLAWKGGKETNIRALLASLDTILWPELGVKKLNMSELISEGQVKVKYMRAIGKVHPDKLNPSNSTVEQRMIAGGVFGALNEAWNAFKA